VSVGEKKSPKKKKKWKAVAFETKRESGEEMQENPEHHVTPAKPIENPENSENTQSRSSAEPDNERGGNN